MSLTKYLSLLNPKTDILLLEEVFKLIAKAKVLSKLLHFNFFLNISKMTYRRNPKSGANNRKNVSEIQRIRYPLI